MAHLRRDEILKQKDRLKKEVVEVPEWGGTVLVSEMSGEARDRWEQSIINGNEVNIKNLRAKLAAATIVNERGALVFKEGDIVELSKQSSVALDRVMIVAQKLNQLFDADIEELAKN